MPVTMQEIDRARDAVYEALKVKRGRLSSDAGIWDRFLLALTEGELEAELETRRAFVEDLLERWWAQGCREPRSPEGEVGWITRLKGDPFLTGGRVHPSAQEAEDEKDNLENSVPDDVQLWEVVRVRVVADPEVRS